MDKRRSYFYRKKGFMEIQNSEKLIYKRKWHERKGKASVIVYFSSVRWKRGHPGRSTVKRPFSSGNIYKGNYIGRNDGWIPEAEVTLCPIVRKAAKIAVASTFHEADFRLFLSIHKPLVWNSPRSRMSFLTRRKFFSTVILSTSW